jgi:uncharacterized protein YecA (UPF0149 family)
MHKDTGKIRFVEDELMPDEVAMKIPPTSKQLERMQVRMKDLCPCGSGKRFKYCCFSGRRKLGGFKK